MFRKDTDSFTCRVRLTLELPIKTRCAELTVLLDRASPAEQQALFPVLVDDIFGPQGAMSWGLRTTTENNGEDFRQLMHFLSPVGPLFKLVYSLLKDPCAKYEFPVSYLPMKVRQVLENVLHPFYSELINSNPQTKQIVSLLLNPFDYYIFHFAFHLINPCHQRSVGCQRNNWNTVYYCLSCDYILHFLPTEPGAQIVPLISYNGKNPFQTLPEIRRVPITSKLLKTSVLNKPIEDYSLLQNLDKHPRSEIWRSETVLTVFIDLWFNNDQINQNSQLNNGPYGAPYISNMFHYELPSVEYMRIIRVFVKQIHSFSLSSKVDQSHMGELKKIALPMLHAKFYIFLRNVIHGSPLDGSFRLVLELWLTYIQPWRYPPVNFVSKMDGRKENQDFEDATNAAPMRSVEPEFLPFIAENLLAFVVIFQQLLPRFARVDLVSPKMAVMLYRITKVFSQPNLTTYLREIEQCVENNHSPSHTYNSHWSSSLPPLSPTSSWSTNVSPNVGFNQSNGGFPPDVKSKFMDQHNVPGDRKWSVIVRQKIYELEGPNFFYKPLFSTPPAQEVYDLVYLIKRSIVVAKELVDSKKQEESRRYSGFFGLFKWIFDTPYQNDEFTLQDRMKVPTYLECSLQNLMEIFGITEVQERESEITASSNLSGNLEVSDNFKFLTPQAVRERMKTIKYEGDPDLLPIQSNEVKVLVRALYQIATKLNEDCRANFHQLYYQNNYIGRIFRQILQPPQTIYRFDKTVRWSPRVGTTLPPRISLRYFANYSFLSYFTIGFLVSYCVFNMSLPSYVLMLVLVYFSYVCVKAVPRKTVGHSYPTQGFGNISFNDSF